VPIFIGRRYFLTNVDEAVPCSVERVGNSGVSLQSRIDAALCGTA
jgi:hypothetical protein